jgi:Pyridine nucleotide-disulphide oxidoreductase, dimerisation domain
MYLTTSRGPNWLRRTRAVADGATGGVVKVLTLPGKDRILGVAMVGEHVGDLLAEFILAMKHGLGRWLGNGVARIRRSTYVVGGALSRVAADIIR